MCIRDSFKVAVDFEDVMPRTPETELATARWIATFARRESPVSYTHLRAHETVLDLVCRLLLEKKTT